MASETMTREDIYREFAKGEDADGLYHVQMDEMADEIIRLRTTAGTGAEQRFVCGGTPTPEGQKELDDFATYLRVKGRIEKQKQTGAGGERVTEANLGRIWSLIRDAVKVAARKNTDGMTYEQESAFFDALAADTEQKIAALAASARGAAS